jgi:hypothetical protein
MYASELNRLVLFILLQIFSTLSGWGCCLTAKFRPPPVFPDEKQSYQDYNQNRSCIFDPFCLRGIRCVSITLVSTTKTNNPFCESISLTGFYMVVTVVKMESRSFSSAEIQHFRTENTRSGYNYREYLSVSLYAVYRYKLL